MKHMAVEKNMGFIEILNFNLLLKMCKGLGKANWENH